MRTIPVEEKQVKIATLADEVKAEEYGVKGSRIERLHSNGYRVPESLFVSTIDPGEGGLFDHQLVQNCLLKGLSRFEAETDSYNIAIRSSPTCSDTITDSYAGHFDSYLGVMDFEEVIENLKSVLASLERECSNENCMGFIIQERIEASHSGVVFSSNPITGARDESVISVESGQAGPLVSGSKSGEDIIISDQEAPLQIPPHDSNINDSVLETVYSTANEVEGRVGYPVDIEWSVSENSGEIFYLQCRPDTGIVNYDERIIPLEDGAVDALPARASDKPQVRKRVEAKRRGIHVPDAFTAVIDCSDHSPTVPELPDSPTDTGRETYTAMLLYPDGLSDEVKQSALPERMQFEEFVERCERYCVRSYPSYNSLADDLAGIAEVSCEEYWEAFVLVQRIYDPEYTGIIRRTTEGYLIEVGRGHLIAKGIIAASEYVITENREIVAENEVKQERQFDIVDGYVLEAAVDGGQSKVEIPQELLLRVVNEFDPLLDSVGTAFEFGIREDEGELSPYLIDAIDQESNEDTEALHPSNNVVSTGEIEGTVVRITDEQLKASNEGDGGIPVGESEENKVFVCDRPDISLLSLLDRFPDNEIGFVFEKGSVLSHLSVVLRERGIPAIKDINIDDVENGEGVTVVADGTSDGELLHHEKT